VVIGYFEVQNGDESRSGQFIRQPSTLCWIHKKKHKYVRDGCNQVYTCSLPSHTATVGAIFCWLSAVTEQAMGLRAGRPRFDSRQGKGGGLLLFATASRPAPVQWMPGAPSLGVSDRGVKPATHFHLVPRLRMGGVIPPLTQMSSWRGTYLRNLYPLFSWTEWQK
jgi:hypothetical protein